MQAHGPPYLLLRPSEVINGPRFCTSVALAPTLLALAWALVIDKASDLRGDGAKNSNISVPVQSLGFLRPIRYAIACAIRALAVGLSSGPRGQGHPTPNLRTLLHLLHAAPHPLLQSTHRSTQKWTRSGHLGWVGDAASGTLARPSHSRPHEPALIARTRRIFSGFAGSMTKQFPWMQP